MRQEFLERSPAAFADGKYFEDEFPALYEYAVIFMDIMMPDMSGYETTRQIRAMADMKKAGIPIIAMTANAFRQDRRAALYAGMNGHVTKPIETEKLLEMIERVLNVLSESFLHLLLWPIFCQLHPNFINVHTVYASEICAHLTKNLLTKSSTKRFREYISEKRRNRK